LSIKDDLKKLAEWSKVWLMLFNVDKCKTMHLGCNNVNTTYDIQGIPLVKVTEEMDLGIMLTENFKVSNQCKKAAKHIK